ncbi:2-hydroxyacid dehydrogenase [Mesobacterium pallidum]|uniref:2-hydroxyacid dehydrogenase n=1 Tax=Mesobacterium pallidum TaxID=2872037 RepID=UPI001EE2E19F|nr:2-hydroxyacid dehydrogenase [Mesobacterium pallidum]
MQVHVFSARPDDVTFLSKANESAGHALIFHDTKLSAATVPLVAGAGAVAVFVNDRLDAEVIAGLSRHGVGLVALRCAGFNNVDLAACAAHGITVARVPAYSPYAVAEHTVALILTLNRKTHRAWARVREGNFELGGLLGFDMRGKTVGIVGTGQIGTVLAGIMAGFGCRVIAHDLHPNDVCRGLGVDYMPLPALLAASDIVTLQCPLTPKTHHLIDDAAIARMKPGAMLINTSRGAVIDTRAVIRGLKAGQIGSLGIDVYEEEAHLFFEDLSNRIIPDDVFARLLTFPNVLVTGHQGFFTAEALGAIAESTLANVTAFERTGVPLHPVEG